MDMELYGRSIIWTDEPEITDENVIDVLRKAIPVHRKNAMEIDFLDKYERGYQPLQRKEEKTYRPDIDFQTVDNVAAEAVEFLTSYHWGNPITLIQRGEVDAGGENESSAVALLNECYDAQDINSKNQKLGRFIEIGAVCYSYVDVNMEYEEGDSYFTVDILDPKFAFVVRSNYYTDHRIILGVSIRNDTNGVPHYTCFSRTTRYEIDALYEIPSGSIPDASAFRHGNRSKEVNPLGMIPIVEWIRADDYMGCFERQIKEMDALNLLISDTLNDVDQQTQAVWHTNDVDFPVEEVETTSEDGTVSVEEVVKKPASGEWLETFTTPDGKQPFIRPLVMEYDYGGLLSLVTSKRSLILQKCGVPERNNANGGSTGVAMSDATGWSAAESSANKLQLIVEAAKMREVRLALKAIQISPFVPDDSPLKKLKYRDVRPNVKRNRSFDLITKSNALATLLAHGVYGLHAFKTVNLFEDNTQVWVDSEPMITAYQEKLFMSEDNSDVEKIPERTASDISDQRNESPVVDGTQRINYSAQNRKG